MDTGVRVISTAELAAGAADTPILDANAALLEPVLIVDLDDTDEVTAAVAARRLRSDRLLVGRCTSTVPEALAPLTAALDLTYAVGPDPADRAVIGTDDVDTALAEFIACVGRYPQSALVAGEVVRASERLPVPEAIDVESLAYSTLQGGAEFRSWLDERRRLGRPIPPPPVADPVLIERDGDILRITLNRPERRNAYGTALRDALVEALRLPLLDDTIGTVVLDGAGSSFCAGGDLDEFGHTPDTATAHLIRTRGGAGRLVAQLSDRTVVHLHGHCIGAGIEIPAFAGRILARPDTVFRLPEVTMGLLPGAGGTVSVPRRIGRWRALHLFVTGAALKAQRALEWGLIDKIN
ncbi:enoyl-CoA hydratase/isomerase family protein [Rhodococcus sp. ACPA1]|uniref:enoyl-CoA hydratase/isomerase family protein n=1 Tax=Rhodococcus sp. ACPA1 TaxID=2028572 RepID=UPI000BB12113|nr:enoyl-CoA hydratase/isomerase family protein [Rhodococcus sp. ACPA1]PBC47556.1 enoyl-CoA hydratase [Rhodococcus sp. ACPA1]